MTAAQMLDAEQGAHRANLDLAALFERADVLVTPGDGDRSAAHRRGEPVRSGLGERLHAAVQSRARARGGRAVRHASTTDDGETMPIALQFAMPRCADLRLMGIVAAAEAAFGGTRLPPSEI